MDFCRELNDYEEARKLAINTLIGVAKQWTADGQDQNLSIDVRDETRGLLFRVSITLQGDFLH